MQTETLVSTELDLIMEKPAGTLLYLASVNKKEVTVTELVYQGTLVNCPNGTIAATINGASGSQVYQFHPDTVHESRYKALKELKQEYQDLLYQKKAKSISHMASLIAINKPYDIKTALTGYWATADSLNAIQALVFEEEAKKLAVKIVSKSQLAPAQPVVPPSEGVS